MTLFEVRVAMDAYTQNEESKLKSDWEIMRTISYYSLIAHIDKKKSSISQPKDLFQFPWEKEEKKVKLSEEEVKSIDEKMTKMLIQNFGNG